MDALPFDDRRSGGRALAAMLARRDDLHDAIVLALPRGGVPVAYEVAAALHAPLDVMVVRKIGMPGMQEYAVGALAGGDIVLLNDDAPVGSRGLQDVIENERAELLRRERAYRHERAPLQLAGRSVLLVDDGIATGSTMRVAVSAARAAGAARVIVAVPVASAEACAMLRQAADDVVSVAVPPLFRAVGCWYRHFDQTSDDEVHALLAEANHQQAAH